MQTCIVTLCVMCTVMKCTHWARGQEHWPACTVPKHPCTIQAHKRTAPPAPPCLKRVSSVCASCNCFCIGPCVGEGDSGGHQVAIGCHSCTTPSMHATIQYPSISQHSSISPPQRPSPQHVRCHPLLPVHAAMLGSIPLTTSHVPH